MDIAGDRVRTDQQRELRLITHVKCVIPAIFRLFYGLVTSKPTPYLAFSRGGGVIG